MGGGQLWVEVNYGWRSGNEVVINYLGTFLQCAGKKCHYSCTG